MSRGILALRGATYVALQTALVGTIVQRNVLGAAVAGFVLSYLWSGNVHRIALSTHGDRLAYATGAGVGAVVGLWLGLAL